MQKDNMSTNKGKFMECDTCRKKAGSPVLCNGCLHNRSVIESPKDKVEKIHSDGIKIVVPTELVKEIIANGGKVGDKHIYETSVLSGISSCRNCGILEVDKVEEKLEGHVNNCCKECKSTNYMPGLGVNIFVCGNTLCKCHAEPLEEKCKCTNNVCTPRCDCFCHDKLETRGIETCGEALEVVKNIQNHIGQMDEMVEPLQDEVLRELEQSPAYQSLSKSLKGDMEFFVRSYGERVAREWFKKGFDESGEGWNGEYTGSNPLKVDEWLNEKFEYLLTNK